jgi:hypothetical protein
MKKMKKLLLLIGFASLTMNAQVPSYVPTNGLLGYWPFNGNVNDVSGNGYNGIPTNISYDTDRFGNLNSSANFPNGNTDSEIMIGNSINPSLFTISVWAKLTSSRLNGFHTLLSKIDQYTLPLLPTNNFAIQTITNSNNTTACAMGNNTSNFISVGEFASNSSQLNEWKLYTLTYDGSNAKYYINGILIESVSVVYYKTNSILSFGNRHLGPNYEFNYWGDLDDIGIWDRALTQNEIISLYQSEVSCQSLVINSGTLSSFNPPIYQSTVTIYPNPASDQITIDCGNLANVVGYHIEIVNTLGQVVFNQPMNTQQYNVGLNTWSGTGVYFVKIYDASNNLLNTKKIILQ